MKSLDTASEPPAPGEAPFKGLEFFDEADANLFFGREPIIQKLVQNLQAQQFLAVVIGASGSGKSSIVRAGLIPALRSETASPQGPEWRVFVMTPTAHPLEALAVALTRDAESVTATATLLDDLVRDPRSLQLFLRRTTPGERRMASLAQSVLHGPHTLLVIDQFEELFTLCRDEFEREQFIDNLLDAVNVGSGEGAGRTQLLTLVITLRADFYSHLAQYPELRDVVAKQQEYIGPMDLEELRRAIEQPALRGGWEFEPGLVDLMLRDVANPQGSQEPGALPLLSHALLETWKRRSGHTMTLRGYHEAGGVRGAIAQTAENTYEQLTLEQQTIARNIFLRLTELGEGTEDTRRRAEFHELESGTAVPAQVREVLTKLADARLVTTSENSAEVAHEALIREWPRLREWLNADRDGLQLHHHLGEAAHEWALLERDASALYRGARLAQAREWADTNPGALNVQERAFLEESVENAKRDAREREEQRERELAAAQKLAQEQRQRAEENSRAANQLRRRALILAGALVLALVLAGLALLLGDRANQNALAAARSATAEQSLALTSAAQLTESRGNPELGLGFALAANRLNPPAVEAQLPLADLAYAPGLLHRFKGHTNSVIAAAFSPDGKMILSGAGGGDNALILWDVLTGNIIRRFSGHTDGIMSVAFSPDGKAAISSSVDMTMILWDVATGQARRTFTGHTNGLTNASFSSDGKTILSSSNDETMILWDTATGGVLRRFQENHPVIATISPDGKTALAGSKDGKLWLTDLATGEVLHRFEGHTDFVTWIAFSPDGKTALSSSYDKTVILWNVETGQLIRRLRGHKDSVDGVAFSPDGKTALSGAGSGTSFSNTLDKSVIWWDLATGQILKQFEGHDANVITVAFSPDGHTALSTSSDTTMILWGLASGAEIRRLTGHTSAVNGVAFSPDGKRAISGGADGNLILTDTATGNVISRMSGDSIVNAVAYSPDGRTVLAGNVHGDLILWDVDSGQVVKTWAGHASPVNSVVFSADGKTALSGSSDWTLILWDVSNGQILKRFTGHENVVNSVALSPDGKRALSGSYDRTVIHWDTATGQMLYRSPELTGVVNSVAFSPDGKTGVIGLADGAVVQLNLDTGAELRRFVGHEGAVKSAVFSPDGKRLLSASLDKTIFEWDVASAQAIRHFVGHDDTVNAVAYSPDGHLALSGSADETVRLWRVDSLDDLIAWTQTHRTISEVPCDQRILYNLTPCDVQGVTLTPTP